KAALAREREAEADRQAAATARLLAVDLRDTRVGPVEWPTLLRWLDQALAERPAGHEFSAAVSVGGAVVELASAEHDSHVLGPGGSVVLRRCRVEVRAA